MEFYSADKLLDESLKLRSDISRRSRSGEHCCDAHEDIIMEGTAVELFSRTVAVLVRCQIDHLVSICTYLLCLGTAVQKKK